MMGQSFIQLTLCHILLHLHTRFTSHSKIYLKFRFVVSAGAKLRDIQNRASLPPVKEHAPCQRAEFALLLLPNHDEVINFL